MALPVVAFENIIKRFPGITALDRVSLAVATGSCHGLVGENGAGKSTLGRLLAGIHSPDGGRLLVKGRPVRFTNPLQALRAGIGIVHQELAFCENMTVAENLCLESLPTAGPFLSLRGLRRQARELLAPIAPEIEVNSRLGDLSVSRQQLVQIAAAVGRGAQVIVFDEPTSSLSQVEAERLHELIRRLRGQGVTCLYISHRLNEIFSLCDTISVLRDGRLVATRAAAELDEDTLVALMIGRRLEEYFPAHVSGQPGEELLRAENLSSPGKFEAVSFSLRAGEVLGLAGLVGAGRTELAEALFGLDPRARGRLYVAGERMGLRSPQAAIAHGLGLVPEDRKRHGLVLSMTARSNLSLPILSRLAKWGWVRQGAERELVQTYFRRLSVRATGLDTPVAALSGGNQQKIVLARWLATHCRVLILDEPTRGVDVGAKAEIHALIDELAGQGAAVLLISSELPEVINLSTRLLVLRHGRLAGELARDQATQENIMRLMAGLH